MLFRSQENQLNLIIGNSRDVIKELEQGNNQLSENLHNYEDENEKLRKLIEIEKEENVNLQGKLRIKHKEYEELYSERENNKEQYNSIKSEFEQCKITIRKQIKVITLLQNSLNDDKELLSFQRDENIMLQKELTNAQFQINQYKDELYDENLNKYKVNIKKIENESKSDMVEFNNGKSNIKKKLNSELGIEKNNMKYINNY